MKYKLINMNNEIWLLSGYRLQFSNDSVTESYVKMHFLKLH